MPKVKFTKPWRHFRAGDTYDAPADVAKELAKKGVIKKPRAAKKKE